MDQEPKNNQAEPAILDSSANILPQISKRGHKKVFILATILFLLLGTVIVAWLNSSLLQYSAFLQPRQLQPSPKLDRASLVAKSNEAKQSIEASFKQVETASGLTSYAVSTHDICYSAQKGLWVQLDKFNSSCVYRVTRYYGFNDDFRAKMIDFDQKINGLGWNYKDPNIMKWTMENYYDRYYGKLYPSSNPPRKYLVSDFPTPNGGYHKGEKQAMEMAFAEKETQGLFALEQLQHGPRYPDLYESKSFQDVPAVFKKITQDNKYVLALAVEEFYFKN